ncbi:MAG TPA: methyl-accepting chemotaxis protein [Oceanospirillales bacterium]|nr:chemotaxis protein [Oceanospirillaceae bacterium]HBS42651.1 methyl-accepting chemotaxis protein [Oceanospirillales bacterium]
MMSFSKVPVRYKILSITAVVLLVFTGMLAGNYYANSANTERLEKIEMSLFPTLELATENLNMKKGLVKLFQDSVAVNELDILNEAADIRNAMMANATEIVRVYPSAKADIESLKTKLNNYFEVADKLSRGMISGKTDFSQLDQNIEAMTVAEGELQTALDAFNKQSLNAFQLAIQQTKSTSDLLLTAGFWTSVFTLVILILISVVIANTITRSIEDIVSSIKDIAQGEGDLTKRIPETSEDEIGDLVKWFNRLLDKLHKAITDIVQSIEPLAEVNNELRSSGARALEAADVQNRSTKRVSSDVMSIVDMITEIAGSAEGAETEAESAFQVAQDGATIVSGNVRGIRNFAEKIQTANSTVQKLKTDSENAGMILQVIQSIAEQTNLLALNAAIEAARAGEQGRGFAVVADEVRTLASRTHESTQEIQKVLKDLYASASDASDVMQDSESHVQESVAAAERTGESLQLITERVEAINKMSSVIASTAARQKNMSESIASSVSEIETTSQQTADSMKEVADETEVLTKVSKTLQKIAGQFRV